MLKLEFVYTYVIPAKALREPESRNAVYQAERQSPNEMRDGLRKHDR